MGSKSNCAPYDEAIRRMIAQGLFYTEIAKAIGVSKYSVMAYCKTRGYRDEVQRRYGESKNQNLEYVSGRVNNRSRCIIRCRNCGHEFSRRWDSIVGRYCKCPNCEIEKKAPKPEKKKKLSLKEKDAEIREFRGKGLSAEEIARRIGCTKSQLENYCHYRGIKSEFAHPVYCTEENAIIVRKLIDDGCTNAEIAQKLACSDKTVENIIKKNNLQRKASLHACPVCGTITKRPKYCSVQCRNKAENKSREVIRRMRIRNAMVDNDITVHSLYNRDNGYCHICGRKTDLEDYVVVSDTMICGNWYPSIDHVIPLSKGGKHSWQNVKLAHRICNSLKSDKVG